MLTWRRPFEGKGVDVALQHVQEMPTPVDRVRADLEIPPAVASLVMKMIEKDPKNRPSARAVMDAVSTL
jgi:serine/threonine protein kinase